MTEIHGSLQWWLEYQLAVLVVNVNMNVTHPEEWVVVTNFFNEMLSLYLVLAVDAVQMQSLLLLT